MSKYKYIVIVILIVASITIGTTVMVYNIKKADTNNSSEYQNTKIERVNNNKLDNTTIVKASSQEERISPNATIIINRHYKKCNHTTIERKQVEERLVNMTKEELKKEYSDYEIQSFSSKEIKLYKELEGECGEHYIIKDDNGKISIYNRKENNELILQENTQISTKYLPEVDKMSLKEGVSIIRKRLIKCIYRKF